MKLYLVQHGRAMSSEQDPDRPLTPEDRQAAEEIAHLLMPLDFTVDQIWHSGKTRARQTAEIYAPVFAVGPEPAARKGLGPNDKVAPLRDELAVATDDTMIVGHLPFLSKLASLLLTGHESAEVIAFHNAGVICLERTSDNRWRVEWIVTPDLIP